MLGWIFIGVLCIIWAIFLYPYLRHGGSPVTSVEEFERKMDFLAETNAGPKGRWVLTPRQGERFLGNRHRLRSRVRQRRRQVFTLLCEATGLALLIGLFPPFHRMLMGAAVLGGLLLIYSLLLVRIRVIEVERKRSVRYQRSVQQAREPRPVARSANVTAPGSRLAPVAQAPTVQAYARATDRRATPNGHRSTHPSVPQRAVTVVVDEDVHLVVHRSDELDLAELRAAAAT